MAQSPDDRRCIFIVGSSRSGTTMMGRILNRHPAVHTFHELHFFEELWSPGSKGSGTSREEALDVAAQLLYRERGGGYLAHGDPSDYRREARAVLDAGPPLDNSTRLDVYRTVLFREAAENDAPVPCEQTPRNGYYLGEILERFPGARVLHMVRDPRDVLLSQKRKWRRRFLGASNIPRTEAIRAWVNYHPLTISQLWRASVKAVAPYRDHPRVRTVAFEEMLDAPEATVRSVCEFVGIRFEEQMRSVRQVGSSHREDRPDQRGIDPSRSGNWRTDGLSDTEIFLCETVTAAPMGRCGYETNDSRPGPLMLALSALLFPVKLGAALLLNRSRMERIWDALRRRLR
jgi:hypothetical protein